MLCPDMLKQYPDERQVSSVSVIQLGYKLCFVFMFSALFFILLSVSIMQLHHELCLVFMFSALFVILLSVSVMQLHHELLFSCSPRYFSS